MKDGQSRECSYCNMEYAESAFQGGDGIMYDKNASKFFIVAEYFKGERCKIEAEYCPKCGEKLHFD